MSTTHHHIAKKDFNRRTLSALAKRGITLLGMTNAPGRDSSGQLSFAVGERVYQLDDNGTHRVRSLLEVIAIAKGAPADMYEAVGCKFNHKGAEGTIVAYDPSTYAEPMFVVKFDSGRDGVLRPSELGRIVGVAS